MIRAETFAGKRVAVFGLGASGNATALSLIAGGAEVAAWDDGEAGREGARKLGIPLEDLRTADWSRFDALALAPGVPLTHPEPHWVVLKARAGSVLKARAGSVLKARAGSVLKARTACVETAIDGGIPVIGDVEIFFRERHAHARGSPVIAITGTNGKSTTTALTTHLLASLGHRVEMGGNIGKAVLTLAPPSHDTIHVLELSSFQIDLTPTLDPTVGVVLNITPDHIDRHGTVESYARVKERLAEAAEAAAIATDDAYTRDMAERRIAAGTPLFAFTVGKGAAIIPRLYAIGTTLFVHETEGGYASSTEIASLDGIPTLRGRHNVQNALAALAAIRALQDRLDANGSALKVWRPRDLAAALRTYPGLAHRMEGVGRIGGVTFVNDSKATNADSTEKALASWEHGIHWILGGKPKEGGITTLAPYFPRIVKAYLIGTAADEFAATLGGKVPFEHCGTLDRAVAAAARDAIGSPHGERVVLLSPACASYDQFRNFEARGDAFRALVSALPGIAKGP